MRFLQKKNDPVSVVSDSPAPILGHLLELRRRLLGVVFCFILAFSVSYHFSHQIFSFLAHPLALALNNPSERHFIYTGLAEAFLTYIKVALFSASCITFPFFAIQMWLFISPGLYPLEKKASFPLLIATPVLFALGTLFAYFIIIPPAWRFFLYFETLPVEGGLPLHLEARISEYVSIVMHIILAFGTSFLFPIGLILLGRLGLVTAKKLAYNRRYAFLILLTLSAFITPPDVLSMLGLAFPLYFLYEISIIIVRFSERKRKIASYD